MNRFNLTSLTPAALLATLRGLPPLAILWRRGMRHFDARAQRERQLVIVALLVLVLLVLDHFWLSGAYKTWYRARTEQRQAQRTLAELQQQSQQGQAQTQARTLQDRAELATWWSRVRAGDEALRAHEGRLVGPDQMLPLLEQLLARHGQLRLRSMQSLARTDLLAPATAAGAPSVAASAPPQIPGTTLFRHGVEISLEGSYAELLSYLNALEALPQRLLWGGLRLKVEQHPRVVLTLRLYTVSREQHFLEL